MWTWTFKWKLATGFALSWLLNRESRAEDHGDKPRGSP